MAATGIETRIWVALKDRLKALTLPTPLEIAWPNVKFPATGTTKPPMYLAAHQLRADPDDVGISKWTERAGLLQVDVCFSTSGIEAATEVADLIAAHFPRGTSLGTVPVLITRTPAIAAPISDGTHTRIPVSIRYRAFTP